LVCVLPFICLLFSNHTNLNYVNGWGLYGEFRYKCNPTRWLQSRGNRYNYEVYIMLNIK